MLKRKLVQAALLCSTLFIILAAVKANDLGYQGDSTLKSTKDSTFQWLFDSALLRVTAPTGNELSKVSSINLNRKAEKFVKQYLAENGYLLKKIKDKHPAYFALMDSVFTAYGLPVELKYLAIIESKLKVTSVSKAGAAGAWQLMPAAARMYSLKVSGKYDERKHFYKSTIAAAKMLRDLHNKFDDWLLVIAAYNSGPGGVYKAIKRSGSRNFWKLHDFLPAETRAHVKRFIGTHYYYEQTGSITTLTRDEAIAYRKTMIAFVEKQNAIIKEQNEQKATLALSAPENPVEKTVKTEPGELNQNKEQ